MSGRDAIRVHRHREHNRLLVDEAHLIGRVRGRAIAAGVDDPVVLVIERLDPRGRLVAARLGGDAFPRNVVARRPPDAADLVLVAPPRRRVVEALGVVFPRVAADIAAIPQTVRVVVVLASGVGSAHAILRADSPPEAYMQAGGEGRPGAGGGQT
ncbi:MAG TPA: hypothetical protein VGH33_10530 [Isosphaeraceae bacterium]|jgi:hypothetical protein